MLHFVVTEKGSFSIKAYLEGEGKSLADRIRVILYTELAQMRRLPLGTWVFTEPDQLDAPHHDLAVLVAERLEHAANAVRIMNDPRRVLLRLDLLRAAHAAGINDHRAWPASTIRLDEDAEPRGQDDGTVCAASLRYPVFVRYANEHSGNLSPLIDRPSNLATALASAVANGARRHELLVVEFCDTSDEEGLYRKYSAYNVGGRIIPRTIECSREWMVKWTGRVLDRTRADDELRYCATNPHEAWIRDTFALARIEYGRIDYGLEGDTPRLWEINTNPTIGGGARRRQEPEIVAYRSMIEPARTSFYERFADAWAASDAASADDTAGVEFDVPDALRRSIERAVKHRHNAERVSSILGVVARQPWVQPVTKAVKRALTPIVAARFRGC